jgi:hypothetical protein
VGRERTSTPSWRAASSRRTKPPRGMRDQRVSKAARSDHGGVKPLGEVGADAINVGDICAGVEQTTGAVGHAVARFAVGELVEHRARKSVDQIVIPGQGRKVQIIHDGGTDDAGVDAALDEIAGRAEGGGGGHSVT